MKRILAGLSVMFLMVSFANANGIFVNPGVRAGSMGGAYTGIADDLTAIWWNPAGLAQQEGNSAEASMFYTAPKSKGNVSLNNSMGPDMTDGDFPLPNLYGLVSALSGGLVPNLEPAVYENKEMETGAMLPFAAGCTQISGITVAAGFYASGGGGGKWDDEIAGVMAGDTISAKLDAQYGFMIGNLSAAKPINDQFSIGLGLNYVYMLDKVKVEKEFSAGATTTGLGLAGYTMLMQTDATGSGIEATAGVMYKPTDKLRVGLVFRSGATVKLSGTAKYRTTGTGVLTSGVLPDADVKTDYDEDYNYPMTYGLGASYQATDALLISAGVDMNRYSVKETNIDYKTEVPGVFADVKGIDEEWKDTTQIRIGAEYTVNEKLAVRAGFYTDPAPSPTDNVTLLNTDQYSLSVMSLGAGYMINESWKVDANVGYAMSDKPSKGAREYEYPVMSIRAGVGYNF